MHDTRALGLYWYINTIVTYKAIRASPKVIEYRMIDIPSGEDKNAQVDFQRLNSVCFMFEPTLDIFPRFTFLLPTSDDTPRPLLTMVWVMAQDSASDTGRYLTGPVKICKVIAHSLASPVCIAHARIQDATRADQKTRHKE